MNFDQAEAEIRAFVKAVYPATQDIAFPDVQFTIPAAKNWIRFTCQEIGGGQVSMGNPGNNRFRQNGMLMLQIFQPQGKGSKDARALATTILTALKGAETANGVHFFDVYGRQVGNDGSGYYQINVFASFWYDEIT